MRNMFLMASVVLCAAFAANNAMAIEIHDLEVTIRVIESSKEDREAISNKLELPDFNEAKRDIENKSEGGDKEHSERRGENHRLDKNHDDKSSGKKEHEDSKEYRREVKDDQKEAKADRDEAKADRDDAKADRDEAQEEQNEAREDREERDDALEEREEGRDDH